ncbi:MAG TPA: hypothetical protein VMB71_06445 [Acetobacteraceae bacterium]|nr:hypothetical protein [Acetobacteraceae bacterium]
MSTLTQALRPILAGPSLPRIAGRAPTAAQLRSVVFGGALAFLLGGTVLVLHALATVTAFQ